jgi:hypothetical protein
VSRLRSAFGRDTVRARVQARRPKTLEQLEVKYAKLGFSLSYTPNNTEVFCSAFDGALAGMIGGRSINQTASGSYTDQVTAANVWAQEFDTLYTSLEPSTGISVVEVELIFLESYAVWDGRAPVALTFAQAAPTISAIIENIEEALASLNFNIPPWTAAGILSGYANGTTPVVLETTTQSLLSGTLSLRVAATAPMVCLWGTINPSPGSFADTPTLATHFFVDGSLAFTRNFLVCAGGSIAIMTQLELAAGNHTFDLQASVSATTGAPEILTADLLVETTP